MSGFELELPEAAALLGYPEAKVARMVDDDILLINDSGNARRIPMASIARYLSIHGDPTAIRSTERVFQDEGAWIRVFGSRADVSAHADFEQFPHSAVGGSLRRAIAISEIRSA